MHRRLIALTRDSRPALALAILAGVLSGWLIIAQGYLVSSTISRVFTGHENLTQVAQPLALLLIVIVGRGALVWLGEIAVSRIAQRVKFEVRGRLLRHIVRLGPAFSQGERTGELTSTVVDGVEALDAYFGQFLPQLIIGILVPVSILLVVLPLDLLSGVILLLTAPLIPFFMYMIGQGAQAAAGRQYGALGRLSSYFLDSLQGLTTLKVFGQSKAQAQNIAHVSDQFRRLTLKVMQTSFLSAFALELLSTISTAIIAVEVGLRLLYGHMAFGEALFILILAPEFYLPLRLLGQRFHASLSGTAAARRIFQVLDTPLSAGASLKPIQPRPSSDSKAAGWNIQLEGVSFAYPSRERPALQGIDLRIEAGQHVALVGATGAGKSTLASLLLGFIQPTEGQIRMVSTAGHEMAAAERGSIMAWVPQRPHLFNDSIAANIRVGNPGASPEEITAAARLARLDTIVEAFPERYETSVAEAGSRLSTGEAQRLALARAFLRSAPILVLDEPTSGLDPENETRLEESTRQLIANRTVVTIAHRLNTVFQADRIVVLRAGRIVETGTHTELLSAGGEYARLVDAAAGTWRIPSSNVGHPAFPVGRRAPPDNVAGIRPSPTQSREPEHDTIQRPFSTASQASVFKCLMPFLRKSWGMVALSILLGSFTIGSSVALMGTSAWLISMAALHPSIAALDLAIVGVRFFGIARAVFRYLERLVTHGVTLQALRNLRVWFYQRLEPLAPARLMRYGAGDLLGRAVADIETLENFYVRVLAPPLTACAVTVAAGVYLGAQNPLMALPLAAFSLGIGLILPAIVQRAGQGASTSLISARGALNTKLVDTLQGLADIVAFELQQPRLDDLAAAESVLAFAHARLARVNSWQSAMTTSLTGLALLSLLILAIPLVGAGRLEGLMLAPVALITLSAFEAVAPIPVAAQWWNPIRRAASRLFDIVDGEPASGEEKALGSQPQAVAMQMAATGERQRVPGVCVTDLSFAYPGAARPALDHVSLEIPAGGSLAIVGPSGAGKTTLASLLLRFWDWDSGDILLGGTPLRAISADAARDQIGLVSPNAHFFDTSIYENLRMAGHHVSQEQVEQAARDAQIHEFIVALPAGYDTLVGEHGLQLSAGERQRLAIARVLIKGAPFLILDEPTANLDPITERLVLQTLYKLMKDRTSLLITHRLVGLENAADILVLDRGRVAEQGTHAALVAHGGLYRRLLDLQNRIWAGP